MEKKTTSTLEYYNSNATDFVSNTVSVAFSETPDMFLEYITNGGKILDFGCGSGRDTKYFLDKGYLVDAVDGSSELCKIASEYTGIVVKQMLFEELSVEDVYDGIWACASILHMEKNKLPNIINKMVVATKQNGVIYMSFKYGDFEGVRNGRYFTYLTEESFGEILQGASQLSLEKIWISKDVRAERGEERWLNIILRKMA